jgi:hypothetical protein
MKITDMMLTQIEEQKKVLLIQSSFPDLVYAVDKKNKGLWLLNRRTGAEIEIDVANVYKFAFELMDVVDIHIPIKTLFRN